MSAQTITWGASVESVRVTTLDESLSPLGQVRIGVGEATVYLSTEAAQSLSDQLVSVLAAQQVTS